MPKKPSALRAAILKCLMQASNTRILQDGPHEIQRKVKLKPDANKPDWIVLEGGLVDGTRFGEKDHFKRDDGALIDFSITVQQGAEAVELVAYDFVIELPAGLGPPFLRIDLNKPETDNEHIGLRSHMHSGVNEDQLIVPAPVMSPVEILTLFLYHLRRAKRERSVRGAFRWDPDAPSNSHALRCRAFRLMSWIKLNGG